MRIKYCGNGIKPAELQVSDITDDTTRTWHSLPFAEWANYGIEILYTGGEIITLSDKLLSWETNLSFKIPDAHSLLILPHNRYYSQQDVPLPLSIAIQYDWYPKKLNIIFKNNNAIFKEGEAVAQAIIIPRKEYELEKMDEEEINKQSQAAETINKSNLATRNWITKDGICQDNLYEVFARLEEKRQLPEEVKKYRKRRIFKR